MRQEVISDVDMLGNVYSRILLVRGQDICACISLIPGRAKESKTTTTPKKPETLNPNGNPRRVLFGEGLSI